MADAENKTHSGNLPELQPLPPTYVINEKGFSIQKQQQQPDLQTCFLWIYLCLVLRIRLVK